ncbi:histidine phosphatase family protein [Pseudomonas fluorescens]|uniref:histidine phosphatase family protein n=1 Tax=Pseudomonas fluorescens group TaxID=136843 RepID=UPI0015E6ACA0|nr:histidine phosphatase family protein [Pseudomonas orientalis]MBD8150012.1 histidine phosphatase family protein [Pseudomonas fluorescens]MBA1431965.1 histidine phosphatase family protein [Pseudomonas orientalis]MBD8179344.1 histidine phosphatase family protein [Pseudomonas fluorescens]MBD8746407.1 histidine phosphatase family protein [Pseudomonas fluorescens]MBD8749828.1 histidine phosphatase family protein [Pseudomonas fluorescens]
MGSIYLIRHGQASFGADDYDVLSPVGVEQAQVLGRHLADLGLTFDRCLSGDLRRQQHTATAAFDQYSAHGLPVPPLEIDSAFNEFDGEAIIRGLLPDLLGAEPNAMHILRNGAQNRSEFQRIFALIIERWLAGTYDPPGLESWQGFVARVEGGLQRILEAADNAHRIAVFTSGGTITALLHLITRMPVAQAFELNWQIVNTSLNQLKFRGREVALASFNSHTHLQLLKAPQLITFR